MTWMQESKAGLPSKNKQKIHSFCNTWGTVRIWGFLLAFGKYKLSFYANLWDFHVFYCSLPTKTKLKSHRNNEQNDVNGCLEERVPFLIIHACRGDCVYEKCDVPSPVTWTTQHIALDFFPFLFQNEPVQCITHSDRVHCYIKYSARKPVPHWIWEILQLQLLFPSWKLENYCVSSTASFSSGMHNWKLLTGTNLPYTRNFFFFFPLQAIKLFANRLWLHAVS